MLSPIGNVWPVGDSKTYGVTDPPGSCGPRDPMWATLQVLGGTFLGTLTGGADGAGGNLTPCPISGVALHGDGHSGFHCNDINSNVATWYGSISTPSTGIFYVGTNDLIAIATSAPGFNMDRLYGDFAQCLATTVALNPVVTWFVCNMDPMPSLITIPEFFIFNAYVEAQVKQYQRQGYPMYLIDLASASITYNSGGIHQDVAGYAATATRMLAAMKTLRPAG